MKPKRIVLTAVAAATVLMLIAVGTASSRSFAETAIGPSGTAAPAPQTGTLTVAVASLGTENYVPLRTQNPERTVNLAWGETLLRIDSVTRKLGPALLVAWSNSKRRDTFIWNFRLRPGVRFNEGKGVVTSADIQFLFRQCLRPDSISGPCVVWSAAIDRKINNFKRRGRYGFSLESTVATPELPLFMSNGIGSPIVVMPSAFYKQVGDAGFAKHPIGSGPFIFKSQTRGESVTLEAVKSHYRRTPSFKTLVIRLAREASTRLALLRSGAVDMAEMDIPLKPQILNAGLRMWRVLGAGQAFVNFGGMYYDTPDKNCTSCPWVGYDTKARQVREALSLAIDRKTLLQRAFLGEGRMSAVPFSWTPGPYPYYDSNWQPPAYNPTRAKALLAQAGYPNGFSMKFADILGYPTLPTLPSITELVISYWQEIGIKIDREPIPWLTWRARMTRRDTGGYAHTLFILLTSDPLGDLRRNFSKEGVLAYLHDPEFDKTIAQGSTTFNASSRGTLARRLGQYMINEKIGASLFSLNVLVATTPRVKVWRPIHGQAGLSNFEYVRIG